MAVSVSLELMLPPSKLYSATTVDAELLFTKAPMDNKATNAESPRCLLMCELIFVFMSSILISLFFVFSYRNPGVPLTDSSQIACVCQADIRNFAVAWSLALSLPGLYFGQILISESL